MHVHETTQKITETIAKHGKRPLTHLAHLGLLGPRFQTVHMTQIDDKNLTLLIKHNYNIMHYPESNLKLTSNFYPIEHL